MNSKLQEQVHRYDALCRGYDDIYRQAALQAGISYVPYYILIALRCNAERLTQSDIQRHSFYPKQTINSAAMRLEKMGYLTLTPDGRKKYLTLTPEGENFCRRWVDNVLKAEEDAFIELSPEEQEALLSVTEKHILLFQQQMKKQEEL